MVRHYHKIQFQFSGFGTRNNTHFFNNPKNIFFTVYVVGSDEGGWSDVFWFKTLPGISNGTPWLAVLVLELALINICYREFT